MEHRSDRWRDTWVATGLFALTLVSRIPFRSRILYHWDSVNFAYALREFSVAKEQPQPPGYIVYVWLCRLVDAFFGDAQTTMVVISIVASALAVVALYCLGRAMFDRRIGLIAALFLATSPLFWFYGEIALPHTLDTLVVIVGVWWLFETMQGKRHYLYPAVAIVAIAGGVRQQTIIFLAPVLLFSLRMVGWRHFLIAGALGTVICLAWFVPLITLSGGFAEYMLVMDAFSRRFQSTTSVFAGGGWWGIGRNVRKLTPYTLYGWSFALVPGVIHAASRLWRFEWPQSWEKPIFFLLWIAPAVIFYTFVHMGQQGLIFVFLPALLLLGAVGLSRLLATRTPWLMAAMSVQIAFNVGVFCLLPEYPLGLYRQRLLTRATLVNSDCYYQDRFSAIEESFDPESTAVLAANWHHVAYYLPEYVRLPFDIVSKWEKGAGNPKGNPEETIATPIELGLKLDSLEQAAIVVFDPDLMMFTDSLISMRKLPLEHGGDLDYFVLTGEETFYYGPHSFGIGEN
jgi:hypothetical protein